MEDSKNANCLSWFNFFNWAKLINILGVLSRLICEQKFSIYTVWDLILGAYCAEINYLLKHLELRVKDGKKCPADCFGAHTNISHAVFFLLRIILVYVSALVLIKWHLLQNQYLKENGSWTIDHSVFFAPFP